VQPSLKFVSGDKRKLHPKEGKSKKEKGKSQVENHLLINSCYAEESLKGEQQPARASGR
jgi:hypothetical protein